MKGIDANSIPSRCRKKCVCAEKGVASRRGSSRTRPRLRGGREFLLRHRPEVVSWGFPLNLGVTAAHSRENAGREFFALFRPDLKALQKLFTKAVDFKYRGQYIRPSSPGRGRESGTGPARINTAEAVAIRLFDIVGMERETQAAALCGGSDHHN